MDSYPMYIGGQWCEAASGEWFETRTRSPASPGPRGALRTADAARAAQAAHQAFTAGPWPEMTATQRGALLRKLGDLIAERAEALAEIEVRDNGKLLAEMRGQLQLHPAVVLLLRRAGRQDPGRDVPLDKKGYFTFTRHEPSAWSPRSRRGTRR